MNKGEVLERSFICNCQKTRITIQMLSERVFSVTCRVCDQVWEALGKNGEIQLRAEMRGEKRPVHQELWQPLVN